MPGLTHTLDIARRALMTHQAALSVIGHNIANASAPGYTRQIAKLEAEAPQRWGSRDWGNGVTLASITQRRSLFLDQRVRSELAGQGGWRMRATVLGQVEQLFNEPSETGLGAVMDGFFAAWSELSSNPEDAALRANALAQSEVMAERFRDLGARFSRLASELSAQLDVELADFNARLEQVADVSEQIADLEAGGGRANDLRDRRAVLLDEMSTLADVQWSERADGGLTLRVGGNLAFDASGARPLRRADLTGAITGGSIGALVELRGETLPELRGRLDRLAQDLITQVNALHRAGPSQLDLLAGSGAGDMAVNPALLEDPSGLNVSTSGLEGENDIALAIAQLRDARIIDFLDATPGEFWSAFVGRLGTLAAEAGFQAENAELASAAAETERSGQQGVSLDEEMAAMISTQHAYLAAARVFDVAGQMMEALLEL
jgi:flagellar hook-associated protein 1 FlgK